MRNGRTLVGAAAIGLLGVAACGKPDREPEVPEPIAEPGTTQEGMESTPAAQPAPAAEQSTSMDQGSMGQTPSTPGPASYPAAVSAPVEQYREWATQFSADKMGLSHDYTAEGITRLAAALRALQNAEPGAAAVPQDKIDTLTTRAERLTSSPRTSLMHADYVREAFEAAVDVMAEVQRRRFPGDTTMQTEIAALRQSAMSIDPQRPLLDQRDKVQRFFKESVAPMETAAKLASARQPGTPQR